MSRDLWSWRQPKVAPKFHLWFKPLTKTFSSQPRLRALSNKSINKQSWSSRAPRNMCVVAISVTVINLFLAVRRLRFRSKNMDEPEVWSPAIFLPLVAAFPKSLPLSASENSLLSASENVSFRFGFWHSDFRTNVDKSSERNSQRKNWRKGGAQRELIRNNSNYM